MRLVVPGAIILVCGAIFGISVGVLDLTSLDINEIASGVGAVVLGVLYRFSGLRSWINARHHERVNENIRSSLVRISGHVDDRSRFSWKKIRRVFYKLVDDDNSLTVLSKRIMFNGLLWTSAADLTAISAIFLGVSLIAVVIGVAGAEICGIIYFAFALVGVIGSYLTTKEHVALGNEQLELIEQEYSAALAQKVGALA
jgi:hypothetical protein